MNMQKYASYKKAAKRIVRLLNEEREMKKEAAGPAARKVTGPIGDEASQADEIASASQEWLHPNTYVSTEVGGKLVGYPRAWLERMNRAPWYAIRTKDNVHTFHPTVAPRILDWTGEYAKDADRMNRALVELNANNGSQQIPSAITKSKRNAKTGWRTPKDVTWAQWFKTNAKNLVAGLGGNK